MKMFKTHNLILLGMLAGLYFHSAPYPSQVQPTSTKEIDYFLEIALGSEHGGASRTIKKWESDIRIEVIGSPTPEDLKSLRTVVSEVNGLVDSIEVKIVNQDPNLKIYFVPVSQFPKYEPNYTPSNYGFCWVGWKKDVIHESRVLISTVGITQKERSHLIREELTQCMGLMRDSDKYTESIFYSGWTDSTKYTEMDKALIRILYSPEIRPGMNELQLREVL